MSGETRPDERDSSRGYRDYLLPSLAGVALVVVTYIGYEHVNSPDDSSIATQSGPASTESAAPVCFLPPNKDAMKKAVITPVKCSDVTLANPIHPKTEGLLTAKEAINKLSEDLQQAQPAATASPQATKTPDASPTPAASPTHKPSPTTSPVPEVSKSPSETQPKVFRIPEKSVLPKTRQEWLNDVNLRLRGLHAYLEQRIARGGGKLAINADFDNTIEQSHYAYGQAVPQVRRELIYASEHGVDILINTGRSGPQLQKVRGELVDNGIPVTEVCGNTAHKPLVQSKQDCRKHFVSTDKNEGYTIIANIGNRVTDFVGGNYERGYKLPDYHGRLG